MMGRQARASTVVMRHREPHDPGSSCLAYQPIPPGPTSPAGHIDRTPGPCRAACRPLPLRENFLYITSRPALRAAMP
jgi:hypothetical protein